MVLRRQVHQTSSGARLWAVIVLVFLWGGCLKGRSTQRLQQETPIAVAIVHDLGSSVAPVPAGPMSEIRRTLAARNLVVQPVAQADFESEFARKRTSSDRYQAISAKAGGAKFSLLVETRAQYFSQILGQFRWTVYVKLSLGNVGEANPSRTSSFSVPVMLMYNHQREGDALAYAANTIANKIGKEVDDFIAGQGLTTLSSKEPRSNTDTGIGPMYFVMVDRFHNGKLDNDGEIDLADPQAFHGGDIAGVIEKLDYIASMGFRTIWLSPVFSMRTEKIGEYGAFHGYWTEDLFSSEARFGSKEELRTLRDELDKRGMTLVLDMVLNHVGYDTKLVAERPEWFHNKGDIKDWNDLVQRTTFDVHGLPDLAQEKPAVYEYLLTASAHWIEALEPAGFRLDAVRHVGNDFWIRYTKALREIGGSEFATIGELFDGDARVIAEGFEKGGFSHLFDFPLYYSMKDSFCEGQHLGRVAATLSLDRIYPNAQRLMTFADNHDFPRLWSACGGDVRRVSSLLTFMLSARGIPTISYGTEIGLAGAEEPENRQDMNFDADAKLAPLIGTLLSARRSHPVLQDGANRPVHLSKDRYAYLRVGTNEVALVLVNMSASPWSFEMAGADDAPGLNLLSGESITGPVVASPVSVQVVVYRAEDVELPSLETKQVSVSVAAEAAELLLVGAGSQMGSWEPSHGILGVKKPNGTFEFTVEIEGDAIEVFKFVRKNGDSYQWEEGGNRYLFAQAISEQALQPVFAPGDSK